MKNFDRFIGIDWSGAKSPINTRSIAVAQCARGTASPLLSPGPWSRRRVFEHLLTIAASGPRTLVGIDANFGYAQTIGTQQFGEDYDFRTLWQAVEKSSGAFDNFFAGGFWEAWPEYFWTQGKKPDSVTLPKRVTEQACIAAGLGHPESPFKLLGPKQVGKGGLAAMRIAWELKRSIGDALCVWPFEREIANSATVVISEIYPRQFLKRAGHGNTKVKTLVQLNSVLSQLQSGPFASQDTEHEIAIVSDHDTDAIVSAAGMRMLCEVGEYIPKAIASPVSLSDASAQREGWIFGL